MSMNSFSSLRVFLAPDALSSSNSSLDPLFIKCPITMTGAFILTVFTFTNILLLLPLYTLVLYIGVQRWFRQRFGVTTIRHSDFFTYHMVIAELICLLGFVFYCYGVCTGTERMIMLGMAGFRITFPGQTLFHCLTCMERYLAVVHPITYMRLRESRGVAIRNLSVLCVWLLCFEWIAWNSHQFPIIQFLCLLVFSVILVVVCSLSVLLVLIRHGPGDKGRDRDGADQSKKKAFHIIMAILGVLLLRFLGVFVCFGLYNLVLMRHDLCVLLDAGIWLTLPSSLVLPLLFLQKAGKLGCCRKKK